MSARSGQRRAVWQAPRPLADQVRASSSVQNAAPPTAGMPAGCRPERSPCRQRVWRISRSANCKWR